MNLDQIEQSLRSAGLEPRGAFHPTAEDGVPPRASGEPARTVLLAGNAGPRMWSAFDAARGPSPLSLDQWSQRVLAGLAAALGARAVFPFEPPYLPFQRWALRAEDCHRSPLGLLIHPDYGLWHGYRGALLFDVAFALPPRARRASPCESCSERACLRGCPVSAFGASGFDAGACARELARVPEPACMGGACLARRACPVGRDYAYLPAQARFHMRAFLKAQREVGAARDSMNIIARAEPSGDEA